MISNHFTFYFIIFHLKICLLQSSEWMPWHSKLQFALFLSYDWLTELLEVSWETWAFDIRSFYYHSFSSKVWTTQRIFVMQTAYWREQVTIRTIRKDKPYQPTHEYTYNVISSRPGKCVLLNFPHLSITTGWSWP